MHYFAYETDGSGGVDISHYVERVVWIEEGVESLRDAAINGNHLTVIFKRIPGAQQAQQTLKAIDTPITFIYGPDGNDFGSVRKIGVGCIREPAMPSLWSIVAIGCEPVDEDVF